MYLTGPSDRKTKPFKARGARGNIAEFPLAMYCFLLIVVFPVIDLAGIATGLCTIYLSTNESATRAANQRRYSDALSYMEQTSQQFLKTGMADFARMKPIGGYNNCGSALYIDASNYRSGGLQSYGPNTPVPPPIDLSNYLYECRVNSSFEVGPTIDLAFLPGLGNVPGIGKPAIFNISASKQAEYPIGLEGSAQPPSNATVPPFNTTATPNAASAGPGESGWNLPTIYDQINSAGQTVVYSTVIQVQANNPKWTPTTINLAAGQKLWIDLRSAGLWAWANPAPMVDANGELDKTLIPGWWKNMTLQTAPQPLAPPSSLIGRIGNGTPFDVGTTYQNFVPGGSGQLQLIFNDFYVDAAGSGYSDNVGTQTVRIIVTQ